MNKLENIKDIVETILLKEIRANDDDFLLYLLVLHIMKIDYNKSMSDLFFNHKKYNLPSFESITRARRFVQAEHPELKGKVADFRNDLQEDYKRTFQK